MSWNVALDMFCDVKNAYTRQFGEDALWDYNGTSCIEFWCERLGNDIFSDMIRPLRFTEFNDLLLMKYDNLRDTFEYDDKGNNLFWSKYNSLYRECRSVVIDIKRDELVLTPFRKFFNVNELPETRIEIIKDKVRQGYGCIVSDKMDGSMQAYRYYNGKIIGSGSQALNPEQSYRLCGGYKYIHQNNYTRMLTEHPNCTFIFEYINPDDPHVVEYPADMAGLYLTGIRHVGTGHEYSYATVAGIADAYRVCRTRIFFDMTLMDMLAAIAAGDKTAKEAEGFVLELDGIHYKMKYDDYVAMHKIYSSMFSPNACLQAVREDCVDDFLSKINSALRPRIEKIVYDILKYVDDHKANVDKWYDRIDNISDDKKSFMISVTTQVPREYQGGVRNKYNGKETDWLKGVKYSQIEAFLQNQEED